MRIVVHDYAGHPFQVQLSRWLAAQGHAVLHISSLDVETPRGALQSRDDDAETLTIAPISTGRALNKYNLPVRVLQERQYASLLRTHVDRFQPDVVISGNAPPTIQRRLLRQCRQRRAGFVYWVQDLYSVAFEHTIARRLGPFGAPAARYVRHVEFDALRQSDRIVVISDDFVELLTAKGLDAANIDVIPNWAPRDELAQRPRDNAWAKAHDLQTCFVFLYSGTLGLKHNPSLLSTLASAFRDRPEVRVVVISNGLGRTFLEREKAEKQLDNLFLYDFLPYADVPDGLASGDVLITILEPYAGVLSVPSKVLSYICAGRALLGAIPSVNLAARTIREHELGLCVSPDDADGFVQAASTLYADEAARSRHAANCQHYRDTVFDIDRIGQAFLKVFRAASPGSLP